MEPSSFTNGMTGELLRITDGGVAFLPAPLPPTNFALAPDVILALDEATTELGRLDGHGQNLPDPQLLIAPFLRKEAVLSSRIEGTQTTFSDLVLFEAAHFEKSERERDNREVSNYVAALQYALARCGDIPVGKRLICEVHKKLLAGIDEEKTRPGRFRATQVHIGPRGFGIAEARYVPPPPYFLDGAFEALGRYIQKPDRLPLLVRLALVHYQFEALHPFLDGNGRIGRLLITLMLCAEKRLAAPMLYLSAYFERRRQHYNDLMLNISKDGQWEPWILFFLRGIALQARDAVQRAKQLQELRERYRSKVTEARATAATLRLVDELFKLPVMTYAIAENVLGFSWQSSRDTVLKLAELGIIERYKGSGKQHLYLCAEIIRIVDALEAVPPPPAATEQCGLE